MEETKEMEGMEDDVERMRDEGFLGVCCGSVAVVLRGWVVWL